MRTAVRKRRLERMFIMGTRQRCATNGAKYSCRSTMRTRTRMDWRIVILVHILLVMSTVNFTWLNDRYPRGCHPALNTYTVNNKNE
jgi:hypothetical protein